MSVPPSSALLPVGLAKGTDEGVLSSLFSLSGPPEEVPFAFLPPLVCQNDTPPVSIPKVHPMPEYTGPIVLISMADGGWCGSTLSDEEKTV